MGSPQGQQQPCYYGSQALPHTCPFPPMPPVLTYSKGAMTGPRDEVLQSYSSSSVALVHVSYLLELKSFTSSRWQATFPPASVNITGYEYCHARDGHNPKELIPSLGPNHCFSTLACGCCKRSALEIKVAGGEVSGLGKRKLAWPLAQFLNTHVSLGWL